MRMTRLASLLCVWVATSSVGCSSAIKTTGSGGASPEGSEAVEQSPRGEVKAVSIGSVSAEGPYASIGGALGKVLNEHPGDNAWKVTDEATKGSRQSIVSVRRGDLDFGVANGAITYFAVRGQTPWGEDKYDMTSVLTLAANVAQFVTTTASGVTTISDLKGKRVFVGPDGSGAEMFLPPILEAHGLQISDITLVHGRFSEAVRLLGDKSIDAAFMGVAGPVPHPLIVAAGPPADSLR